MGEGNNLYNTLPSEYQKYIHLSRYARWREDWKRRENWQETVARYLDFMCDEQCEGKIPAKLKEEMREVITTLQVMPSMRCMMTAGKALARDNVAAYNCSYLAFNNLRAFDEMMYILMNGVGVGFSVERQYVNSLPEVAEEFHESDTTIKIQDSKIGWCNGFKELISVLYSGNIPKWDMSSVRKAGDRLKTFGGRASGPEPLEELFKFTVNKIQNAAGRRLNSIEVHDIACKIGECVLVGGVRRSACISLSNLSDDRMRNAKRGDWHVMEPQRGLANNSVCYTERPEMAIFLTEWQSLIQSKSGERGIFNRVAATKKVAANGRRDTEHDFGVNPCAEIILRICGLCNLSEVVIRPEDTYEDLKRKVIFAAIFGTMQATLTNFRYLTKQWRKNAEEEALLGVSLTGILDHPIMSDKGTRDQKKAFYGKMEPMKLEECLESLKAVVVETNKKWAKKFGINQAAATTSVKPSGTVSQLVDSASGIHPRWSPYYIRRVRASKGDPLSEFLKGSNVPCEDDMMSKNSNYVFSFPVKSPKSSICRKDFNAMDQLRIWMKYEHHWCEHKPSITVYVKDHEWLEVGAWVYKHFDDISGISFLPYSDHIYPQAPYEECERDEYKKLAKKMPTEFQWDVLAMMEDKDNTNCSQIIACTAGGCDK